MHHLAHGAAGLQQGPEGHNGGQNRKNHGTPHLQGPLHGCFERWRPLFAVTEHVLTHNDGVIHHDAQHHYKGEKRRHVEGDIVGGQQDHTGGKRDGDAQGNPEGQTQVEENPQQENHQAEAVSHVFDK